MEINDILEEGSKVVTVVFWTLATITLAIMFSPIWIPGYILFFTFGLASKGIKKLTIYFSK